METWNRTETSAHSSAPKKKTCCGRVCLLPLSTGDLSAPARPGDCVSGAMDHQDCNVHPSFKSKPVFELRCRVCESLVCVRGMRAILLADRNVELYSTDLPPPGALMVLGRDYETENCRCRISNAACGKCGIVVGYHVTLPCQSCLSSCNNGHLWMYNAADILASERLDYTGEAIMVWARIPVCSDDVGMRPRSQMTADWVDCCR